MLLKIFRETLNKEGNIEVKTYLVATRLRR